MQHARDIKLLYNTSAIGLPQCRDGGKYSVINKNNNYKTSSLHSKSGYYAIDNWWKNFDERPHRRRTIFQGRQCNVTSISREHCSRLQQSRCHAVIEDWIIPFAAYTSADTHTAFQWAEQPSNSEIAPSHEGIWTPSNTWFFGSTWVSPKTASRSVQPSLYNTSMWPSHIEANTQTTLRHL